MKRIISVLLITLLLCSCTNKNDTKQIDDYLSPAYVSPIESWEKYDNLLSLISSERDISKRNDLIRDAEDILMATNAILPLYYQKSFVLKKAHLDGVVISKQGGISYRNARLTNGSSTLNCGILDIPDIINPSNATTNDELSLVLNTYCGLYTIDKNNEAIKDLAKDCYLEKIHDNLNATYVIELKENAKWSNGDFVTANDYIYAWNRAKDDTNGYLFENIVGYPDELKISARDHYTIEITFKKPCNYLEELLAFPAFFPMHKTSKSAFNGPFTYSTDIDGVTLTKNANYIKADKVSLEKVSFKKYASVSEMLEDYNNGKLDILTEVPDEAYSLYNSTNELIASDLFGTYCLTLNVKGNAFSNRSDKKMACCMYAIQTIIDRKAIITDVLKRDYVAASSIIPKSTYFDPYKINTSTKESYSIAREYLTLGGYELDKNGKISSSSPFPLVYLTIKDSVHHEIANYVKEDLETLGITVTIKAVDAVTYLYLANEGSYDITHLALNSLIYDPYTLLQVFSSTSATNLSRFGK